MESSVQRPFAEARRLILKDRPAGMEALELAHDAYVEEFGGLDPSARCSYANALIEANQPEVALPEAIRAAEHAHAAGDLLVEARSLQTRAICHWSLRQFDVAHEVLESARKIVPDGDLQVAAGIEELQGLIYLGRSKIELAIECLLTARDHLRQLGGQDRLARNGINLISCYQRVGDMKRALAAGLETRRALEESENEHSKFILAFNMAAIYVGLKDWDAAAEEIERTRGYRERLGEENEATGVDCLAAQVALNQGDKLTAVYWARHVATQPEEMLTPLVRLNCLSTAAEVLFELGELKEADSCYARALRPRGITESPDQVLEARIGQLNVWLAMGRLGEVESAMHKLGAVEMGFTVLGALELDLRSRLAEAGGDMRAALAFERRRSELLVHLGEERADRELKDLQVIHHLAESRAVRCALERSNKELEVRVREQTQALERAQRLEALGRLAGGVAHDFNNLLTVLGGSAQLLENELGSHPAAAALVTEMLLASERGARLSERLLAFGRRIDLSMNTRMVGSLLENTRFLLERLIGEEIELEFRSELSRQDQEQHATVDEAQLDSVLMNLALNARDAMPRGGRLTFTTRIADDHFLIDVADTGEGVAAEVAGSLFEPFSTTKEPGSGTGLGLPSSLGIIEEMGGSLTLETSSKTGSLFRICLPVAPAEAELQPEPPQPSTLDLTGLHALVVEDDAAVRGLLAAFLRHLGLNISEAIDGQAAHEQLLAATESPDLVVCDVSMPRCGGPELLARVRATDSALPFLFVSGWHGRYIDELPKDDPTVDFLEKPIEIAQLAARLRTLIAATPAYKSPIASSSPSA